MKTAKAERNNARVPLFAAEKQAALKELRADMLRDKEQLNTQLRTREIDAVEFAHKVNALMANFLRKASKILNRREFEQAFGISYSPEMPIVIDPETAAHYSQHK